MMKLPLEDSYELLKSTERCFFGLKSEYLKSPCQHKSYSSYFKRCNPSIIHLDPRQSKEYGTSTIGTPDQNNNRLPISSTSIASKVPIGAGNHTRLAPSLVSVILKSKNSDTFVTTYAFLDSATFCSMEIARELHLE